MLFKSVRRSTNRLLRNNIIYQSVNRNTIYRYNKSNYSSHDQLDKEIKKENVTLVDTDIIDKKTEYELLYTSSECNLIYLGKAATLFYGAICVIGAPFILMYPFDSVDEFQWFFKSYLFRGSLSSMVGTVGILVPRYYNLITRDHVLKMYFCRKTNMVKLQTVQGFGVTKYYEMNINDLTQISKDVAFGPNNIICKKTQHQFYIDSTFLDDDIQQMLGFYDVSFDEEDIFDNQTKTDKN